MKNLTKEQQVWLSDDFYTPISLLRDEAPTEPNFKGPGEHSVRELEEIIQKFQEYCYYQKQVKEGAKKAIIKLKFGENI